MALTSISVSVFQPCLDSYVGLFSLRLFGHLSHSSMETQLCIAVFQRGPTTFDLRAILQKCDNSRATSSKMVYKTTNSQDLKL